MLDTDHKPPMDHGYGAPRGVFSDGCVTLAGLEQGGPCIPFLH